MTKEQLESGIDTTLTDVTEVDGANIASPSPVDLAQETVSKNATTKTISEQSVDAQTITAPAAATYDQVTVETEITNESLNRTAESLKESINGIFSSLTVGLNNALGSQSTNVTNALKSVSSDVNSQLSALKIESDSNVDAVNSSIAKIVSGMNIALEDIRTKNVEQSNNVATQIDGAMSEAEARDAVLKTALDEVILRIQSLDEIYNTDADMATTISEVNSFIATLEDSGLSIVDAIKGTVVEVNAMSRVEAKHMTMNAPSGITNINLVAVGFPEAIAPDDYIVHLDVANAPYTDVRIDNKDETGFDLLAFNLKTMGRVPQDCSANNVKVGVSVVYKKLNPLTFDIDLLDDAFMTDGNGTDTVTV